MRSAVHLTGRRSARAQNAATTSSGYSVVFMPKPPPMSPTSTRTCSLGMPSTSAASSSRRPVGVWQLVRSVMRLVCGSKLARVTRGSIGDGARRWFRMSRLTTCAARANAASAAAALPCCATHAMLPVAAGHTSGAPGAIASAMSATIGNGFVAHVDRIERIARLFARFRDDRRDGLADEADGVHRQRMLRRRRRRRAVGPLEVRRLHERLHAGLHAGPCP